VLVAYFRTVKTASGATAVQIVQSNRRGSREIEHIGSAHSAAEVEVLKTVARQRLHANQDTLDLDDGQLGGDEAPIVWYGTTVVIAGVMWLLVGLTVAIAHDLSLASRIRATTT
jgi:hypothetical protein